MNEENTQPVGDGQAEAQTAPDALIEIRWNGASFAVAVQRSQDLNTPAAHLADWLARNLQPLSMMAAVDWNAQREREAAAQLQKLAEGGSEPEVVESATPRLLAANGGPLQ